MNKVITSTLLTIMLIFATSCQDWLNVNHDPNVIEKIPNEKVLLPAAQVGIGNNLMGWDLGFSGGFWAEYWTQKYTASQFKFLCEYNSTSFGTAYTSLTSGVLMDLTKIKEIATASKNNGTYFIAEALSIYTWQIMTDLWGAIPYTEALKGSEGISSPKFDSGESIYADLMKRIDDLLKVDINSGYVDSKYDFIYAGDMNKWKLFAQSLKLKLMLRLSETSTYDNATVLAYVKANSFLTESAKISGKFWSDSEEGKRHPMREFEEGDAKYLSGNVIACKNFIDYLNNNRDPRCETLFKITDKAVGYRGAFFGDFDSKEASDGKTADDKVAYSTVRFDAEMDLMIMSDWEVDFYIAEVYARAISNDPANTANAVNAKKYYEAGVKASLKQHNIETYTILEKDGYAEWKDGTSEEMIKQIGMQKWVANANYQHIESFLERNRIKYPAKYELDIKLNRKNAYSDLNIVGNMTVAVNGRNKLNGSLPASPLYPDAVTGRNENAPDQKANIGEKVWWNKKAEIIIK